MSSHLSDLRIFLWWFPAPLLLIALRLWYVWYSVAFDSKLLHQWGPVDTIIIIILEPFAFFVVKKILTLRAGIIPALVERQHLICDRYFSYSVLCLAINDIKVLFVKVYVFFLGIYKNPPF